MKNKEKDVRYLNRDFDSLKDAIINFSKVYYPETYNDFSPSSTGMIWMEMASYVGDVLSYYTDVQFKESLIQYAEERKNVVSLASALGYHVKPTKPAIVILDLFIVVPAIEITDSSDENYGEILPDWNFAPVVDAGMVVGSQSRPEIKFRTLEPVDFGSDSVSDPMDVKIYEIEDTTKAPKSFLLKKQVRAVAGTVKTETYDFNDPEKYAQILLPENDVIDVIDVTDAEGNKWYEVPYLAQETVFEEFKNTMLLDPVYATEENIQNARYMISLKRVPYRFTRRTLSDNRTVIQFGGGISKNPNELLVPNPKNVGNPTISSIDQLELPIDPSNFLITNSYGQVPYDTTLYITYAYGGGVESNVPNDDLNDIIDVSFSLSEGAIVSEDQILKIESVKNSLAVTNSVPATGGGPSESIEEIRQNAMSFFMAQNRAVTAEDYIVRAYSMPEKYGSISKVHVSQDSVTNRDQFEENPLAINMYVLGYNQNKQLVPLAPAVKRNLKTYLSQYRMMTDAINIKDGYIVNIGIYFEIIVFNNYNNNEVLLKALNTMREMFSVDNVQFSQPIIKSQVMAELDKIPGVQNVAKLEFENLYDTDQGYAGNIYDLQSAERDGIIYPSLDPSIFEVRFPDKDIRGRAL